MKTYHTSERLKFVDNVEIQCKPSQDSSQHRFCHKKKKAGKRWKKRERKDDDNNNNSLLLQLTKRERGRERQKRENECGQEPDCFV